MLRDSGGAPDLILIASGSEVALATEAAVRLAGDGIDARVVSMPCTQLFDAQDDAYREQVLPAAASRRVAIEAGVGNCWYKYVGHGGRVIALDSFGKSAPAGELFEHFGFSVDNVTSVARALLDE